MANLIDFSQIVKAAILVDSTAQDCAKHPSEDSKKLLKHFILNSLRANMVLHKKYGKTIIACDSHSWRKDVFPQYKWKRSEDKKKDESGIKWDFVFGMVDELLSDIQEFFPMIVVKVHGAEGDDIIAVLTEHLSSQSTGEEDIFGDKEIEPILITSSDRDNFQLHKYKNVKQYSPMDKKLIKPSVSVREFLIEKIVKGDSGDGVMNIRMGDNTFVDGIRQLPIAQKVLDAFYAQKNPIDACTSEVEKERYIRNEQLVSYECIPQKVRDSIMLCYNSTNDKKPSKMALMSYLTNNRMSNLLSQIHDFF